MRSRTLWAAAGLLTVVIASARAELPPHVYVEMQKNAPEIMEIRVERVSIWPPLWMPVRSHQVKVVARILEVSRSVAGHEAGEVVLIRYAVEERPEGWAGPRPLPLLEKGHEGPAWLRPANDQRDGSLEPASRGWSFEPLPEGWDQVPEAETAPSSDAA